jgi:large subunit ribosomal protein L9
MKVQVILTQNFGRLGKAGDLCSVQAGYARNYLIPNSFAIIATSANIKALEQNRVIFEKSNSQKQSIAEKIAETLNNTAIVFIRSASDDGILYGSVRKKDILNEVQNLFLQNGFSFDLKAATVQLDSVIKELGVYRCRVILFSDVTIDLLLNVCRAASEAKSNLESFNDRNI